MRRRTSAIRVFVVLFAITTGLAACNRPFGTAQRTIGDVSYMKTVKADFWTAPRQIQGAHSFYGLSCVTSSFCMASGTKGTIAEWNGVAWTIVASYPTLGILWSVSCSSTSYCMAVGDHATVMTWNGATWSKPLDKAPGHAFTEVVCATSQSCYIGDSSSDIIIMSGSIFQTVPITQGSSFFSMFTAASCVPGLGELQQVCVFGDNGGRLTVFQGTKGFDLITPYLENSPVALWQAYVLGASCVSTSWCAVVGANGGMKIFKNGSWRRTIIFDQQDMVAGSISCVSRRNCYIVNDSGRLYHWNGKKVTSGPRIFSGESLAISISCPEKNTCVAVNSLGQIAMYHGPS